MLDFLAVAASGTINWSDLGLANGIDLGFFTLRFYSLAYLVGLIFAYWHTTRMIKAPGAPMAQRHVDDLFFYCMLGVILGGRLGYATFYTGGETGIPSLWTRPQDLVAVWNGGMSFHGGVIGVVVAIGWVCWRGKLSFIRVADYISVSVGMGMLLGRLANFINGELWGRAAGPDVPWAMTFCDLGMSATGECVSSFIARHPSQLYEALLEGALVLAVMLPLFWKTRARYRPGLLVGTFTVMIASARFIVEFFREPDAQLAEFAASTGLSMGQWLTIPLVVAGVVAIVLALRRPEIAGTYKPAAAE